jgi:tetratricopeptide (TPR) repeat protein
MARHDEKMEAAPNTASRASANPGAVLRRAGMPLLLALISFLIYLPSLGSDFVYDARIEILQEGFVTSLSNLPDVLTFKVLGMNLMLGDRPGQLLYLMLIAAVCGKAPFGYHLCGCLLHAANVALLFILLRRLLMVDRPGPAQNERLKILLAAGVSLVYAVHPMNVESVAEVSYSSSLLATFFTLLSLLAATAFRADGSRSAMIIGVGGVFCAFAAVACKESGIAAAPLLIVYWWLFRRGEGKRPWLLFLGAAMAVTVAFLAARFLLAPPAAATAFQMKVSLSQFLRGQPRLWVSMMARSLCPLHLSADYSPENIHRISMPVALAVLAVVGYAQAWLSLRSRIGALGVAIYWLGLAPVSNLIPLYHAEADRYYYLPLAGAALQVMAVALLLKPDRGLRVVTAFCFCALVPLAFLTVARQAVFANEFSLWSATVGVSHGSVRAHNGLGNVYFARGQFDQAIAEYQTALKINPRDDQAHSNLGAAMLSEGSVEEAVIEFRKSLELNPNLVQASYNLALALFKTGRTNEAIAQYRRTLELNPRFEEAHNDLGIALAQEGRFDEAVAQLQEALRLNPDYDVARNNLIRVRDARQSQLSR